MKPLFRLALIASILVSLAGSFAGAAAAEPNPSNPPVFLPLVNGGGPLAAGLRVQAPELTLTPSSVPASALFRSEGSNFANSPCGVNLYWEGAEGLLLGSASIEDGAFSLVVMAPATATLGEHTILAQGLQFSGEFCGGPSGETAEATLTIAEPGMLLPYLTVDTLDATPGATVHLTGAGFCAEAPCTPLTIFIGGQLVAQEVAVNPDGTFEADVKVPGGTPIGENMITATQTGSQGEEINAYEFLNVWTRPNFRQPGPDKTTGAGTIQDGGAGPLAPIQPPQDKSPASLSLPPQDVRPLLALVLTLLLGASLLLIRPLSRRGARRAWVPTLAVLAALALLLASFPLQALAVPPSVVTDVNPDGLPGEPRFGGRSLGLTVSPTNNQNLFVASELGGIFQSTNGGTNWSHIDAVPLSASRDVMYDPQDANILIATGSYDGRVNNMGGIWRSTDGGASWAKPATSNPSCSNQASAWGVSIPDDGTEHDNVFVGTDCGLAISADSGATWTHVDPCPSGTAGCAAGGTIFDVETRVVSGNIQVDVCGNEGFFRSSDGGTTWTAPDANSPSKVGLNPCHIATAPNDPNTVYLANWSGVNASGFCVSQLLENSAGGAAGSWTDMGVTASNCRDAWVVTHPALDGNADHYEVYFGSSVRVLHQTCDVNNTPRCAVGAGNWPTADSGAHSDPSDIAFDTSTANGCPIALSTDGGISTSTDCGATWVDGNRGLHALDIVAGMAGTIDAGHTDLYFGTQDNGLYFSQDGAATWTRPVGADIYNIYADHTPPANVLYRNCFGCSDVIATAHLASTSPFNDPPGNVGTFAVATQFGNNSYAFLTSDNSTPAQWTAYVTTNGGTNWAQLGPSPLPGNPGEIRASGPAATPTFYLRLNVGGQRRIYRLSGALDSTATLALANNGLSFPTAWGVDPNDPNLLYAADIGSNQMMSTTDGGANWNPDAALTGLVTRNGVYRFNSNVGPQPRAVSFDGNSNTIMVGTTTAGLLVSVTDGQAWLNVPGAESLPRYRDFFFDESNGDIYAATRGRGIWRISLNYADLSVTKSDTPDPVAAGTVLTYTLNVTNNGPDTAYDASLVDNLPPEVSYLSDDGGCLQAPAGTLTCSLGDLANGASAQIVVTVQVPPDLVFNNGAPLTITNHASVSSATPDLDLSNNSASEDTLVVAVADLAIVSFQAVNPPAEILVGQDVDIVLEKVITNYGPSAPMDARLTTTGSAPPDATITINPPFQVQQALGLNEMRVVTETATINCSGASHHLFHVDNEIMPNNLADTDPDLSNNTASLDLDIECVVPVALNIKPGSFPNSINPDNQGVIPLAILTTSAGEYGLPLAFDATLIDPLSVRFGLHDAVWNETGGAFEAHQRGHYEDSYELDEMTHDGDIDLVLHFRTQETGVVHGTTEMCVKGDWTDSGGNVHKFFGCDSVRTVPPWLP